MKKPILLILILIFLDVSGHEFWIQPDKFIYKRGETVNLKFLVGEHFSGENWSGDKNKVNNMSLFFGEVSDTSLGDNLSTRNGDSLQLALLDEGTIMVTCNTSNSFIELEGPAFNQYLLDEGISEALEYRQQNGDTLKKGSEYYQRSVKTLFQVGEDYSNTYKQKTNLPVDIIPKDNPYKVAKDGDFKIKILFMGEKLKNAKVKVWHRLKNKINEQDYTTDEDGELKIFLSTEGEWMVSCVKMTRLQNDPKAEWQSYWGSLTWGYY